MISRTLADLVVIMHLLFIVFSLLGGLLIIWRSYLVYIHLPAAIWVSIISFKGWICPLTPLENQLRNRAGGEGYAGGFIEHYIIPVIYPADLTVNRQIVLGVTAAIINIVIYLFVFYKHKSNKQGKNPQ